MTKSAHRPARVRSLIEGFPRFLSVYNKEPAFSRTGQLELHLETIQMRRELGSACEAIKNDQFLASLYQTLNAWGIGRRSSRLLPFEDFVEAIRAKSRTIEDLDYLSLEEEGLDVGQLRTRVWRLIETLGIVENNAPIVSGTKTLHHILPDVVVPMDRMFTQRFFGWHNPQFQYNQAGKFAYAFHAFAGVAKHAKPSLYATGGWNSSLTKVIDNAVVGFVMLENAEGT